MPSLDQALSEIRALRGRSDFAAAQRLAEEALSNAPPGETRRALMAESAHLLYYRGRFSEGVALARQARTGPPGLARGRAAYAESINLIALNRGNEALAAVQEADLDLRTSGGSAEDRMDVLIQQAHVEANMGRHASAVRTARAAVRVAERSNLARELVARARYTLGFALSYAGDDDAIAHLLGAEVLARDRVASLHRWILFCIATHLRDLGWHSAASDFLGRSNVALRHERAWFAVRTGHMEEARGWLRIPIKVDERPYARVLIASLARARKRRALASATRAVDAFRGGGLDHWRWGAEWVALSLGSNGPTDRLSHLIDELSARTVYRWGFFDPPRTLHALRHAPSSLRSLSYVQELTRRLELDGQEPSGTESSVLIRALGILLPEALQVLRAELRLSPSEIRTLVGAVDAWLRTGGSSRLQLGADLGIGEATVRSHIASIRSKLDLGGSRRGAEPLVAWLADRSLLTPEAALRAVRVLTRRD